jgi:hypothetical protein
LYESQIGEEHAVFRADELKPRTKEDYLLRRLRTRPEPHNLTHARTNSDNEKQLLGVKQIGM